MRRRRSELARKIEGVLERLRYAHPEIAKIYARASHAPGVLLLGVKPVLFRAVAGLLDEKSGPVMFRTGNAAFDALNVKLGLKAVRPYRRISVLVMCLSERANIEAARRAYMKIAGVEYAEARHASGRRFGHRGGEIGRYHGMSSSARRGETAHRVVCTTNYFSSR